jgi:hypothetical protein
MKNTSSTFTLSLSIAAAVVVGGVTTSVMAAAPPARGADILRTPPAQVTYRPLDPRDTQGKGPQISIVFGEMNKAAPVGFLFKVPGGFRPGPHRHTRDYYSVVLEGIVHDFVPGAGEGDAIGPGGFWFQAGNKLHDNHCASATPCVIFIYSPSGYDYLPAKATPSMTP